MVPEGKRNPLDTTTYGTEEIIRYTFGVDVDKIAGACWHEMPGNKGAEERWYVA